MMQSGSHTAPLSGKRRVGTLKIAVAALIIVASPALADQGSQAQQPGASPVTRDDIRRVAPASDKYAQDRVLGEL
jgi:hypothetical protein